MIVGIRQRRIAPFGRETGKKKEKLTRGFLFFLPCRKRSLQFNRINKELGFK